MTTKIIVVTHKEYEMPDNPIYIPVCVGKNIEQLRDKYQSDDEGNNISYKNAAYCELTALYWAWKNLECDVAGIVHYRRHLTTKKNVSDLKDIINEKQIADLLQKQDAIVAWPRRYPETVKNHYIRCEKGERKKAARRIGILEEVIKDNYSDYFEYFEKVINGHKAHMFNIFIMKKQDADAYCEWLFSVLFEVEKRIEEEGVGYPRYMGELSEFLLDVWLQRHQKQCYEARLIQYGYSLVEKMKFVVCRRLWGKR